MLKIEGLSICYGAVKAVEGVSLEVGEGEVVSIIGGNGAGKTSLMRGIAGIEPLVSGRITLDGEDITGVPAYRRLARGLALAPEGRRIFGDQTVLDNLLLGGYCVQADRHMLMARVQNAFDMFPRLRERSGQMAGTLSGGEQQMLAIGRALMSSPRILLLDEPSLGLAPVIIRDIFRTISQLKESGLTILLVEQMARQALAISDRAYVLATSRIVASGTGVQLLNDPTIQAAYLGASAAHA